jgi:hypothetical protein
MKLFIQCIIVAPYISVVPINIIFGGIIIGVVIITVFIIITSISLFINRILIFTSWFLISFIIITVFPTLIIVTVTPFLFHSGVLG